ncbi:hypothetical protein EMIT0P294_260001 [Pseudomonas sp. IT-P294]
MQKVGMRSRCNIPCNSADGAFRPLYFGARMSHQSFGTEPGILSCMKQMTSIPAERRARAPQA